MSKLITKIFSGFRPSPAEHQQIAGHDPAKLAVARRKRAAERKLRAEGHSRKEAARLVHEMFGETP